MKLGAILVLALLLVPVAAAEDQDPEPSGSSGNDGANDTSTGSSSENKTAGNSTGDRSASNGTDEQKEREPRDPESEREPKEREDAERPDSEPKRSPAAPRADEATRAFVSCVGGNGYGDQALSGEDADVEDSGLYELKRLQQVAECCEAHKPGNEKARDFCAKLFEKLRELGEPKHISLQPIKGDTGFEMLTVDGRVVLERFQYVPVEAGASEAERKAGRVIIEIGDEARMVIHDNPTGLLKFEGPGTSHLRFPEGATVQPSKGGAVIQKGGWNAFLRADNVTIDGREVSVQGDLRLQLIPKDVATAVKKLNPAVEQAVEKAVSAGKAGAVVNLKRGVATEVLAYDEVDIDVVLPDKATPETPIRVEFDAKLGEGRTFVVDVDPELLDGNGTLDLRYYDVVYTNGTRHQVEVSFAASSSLEDVMDPTDDGIQPEYWIVEDADGVHVMVSVPTWSIHAVTIASLVDFVTQPSILVGVMAGSVGSLVAAVWLLRPREEEDY